VKSSVYIFILIVLGFKVNSQDIHFSQFNENPSLINPALTGASSPIRASISNRDQWRSVSKPYKTIGASFETRFKADTWKEVEGKSNTFKESTGRIAAGLSFYKDKVGDGNLGQTQTNLSVATYIPLNKTNFVSVGVQGSLVQRMIDHTNLLFSNQYNGSGYDPNQPSQENFVNLKFTYFDIAAGAQWTYSKEQKNMNADKQFTSHFGFAVYHISQPKQEYFSVLSKTYMKYVSHGDVIASIGNTRMAISPSYLIQFQGPSKEIIAGAMLRHYLNSNSKYTGIIKRNCLGYGLYYRSNDAILFSALLEWQEKMAFIMSYDLNISSLSPASSFRGGFEVTLRYTAPKSFLYQRK
jgi:type IX secretion system PorP/SprF family membrane protein